MRKEGEEEEGKKENRDRPEAPRPDRRKEKKERREEEKGGERKGGERALSLLGGAVRLRRPKYVNESCRFSRGAERGREKKKKKKRRQLSFDISFAGRTRRPKGLLKAARKEEEKGEGRKGKNRSFNFLRQVLELRRSAGEKGRREGGKKKEDNGISHFPNAADASARRRGGRRSARSTAKGNMQNQGMKRKRKKE